MNAMRAVLAAALCAACAPEVRASVDESEARAHLTNFTAVFDHVRLERNEGYAEAKWFAGEGRDAGVYLKDEWNNDKQDLKRRMAALFLYYKNFPEKAQKFVDDAEASPNQEIQVYSRRLRAYFGRSRIEALNPSFDNTQADGYLTSLATGFDALHPERNLHRHEVQWFGSHEGLLSGEAYDFLEKHLHEQENSMAKRQASLFCLCKGWPVRAWNELRKAEASDNTDMAQFAKRCRALFSIPEVKPKSK